MNTIRTRLLLQMLFVGLGPLTVFTLGIRFMPGGLLPWLWFALVAFVTAVLALGFSGRAARPLQHGITAFRGLVHPEKGMLSRQWVPEEFWQVREDLKNLLKDIKARNAELETAMARQTQTVMSAERAAVRSLEVLHGLVETSADGVVFMHSDGHLALINQVCMDLFQLKDDQCTPGMDGKEWLRLVASQFTGGPALATEWEAWQAGPPGLLEGEWIIPGASPRVITVRTFGIRTEEGEHMGRIWLFKDVTSERYLSQRLQDSQKLESMGQLAGGIAHDFNNLLTAIRGSLSLAQLDGLDPKQRHEHLDNATRAAARATELVSQILGYSRGKTAATSTDVKSLVTDLQNLLKASLDPKISLQCEVGQETWLADLPHVQLEQVVLNLCLNARDALGAKGGSIRVFTSHFHKSEHKAGSPSEDALLGDYVVVHVRDNGSGIPEAVRERLFEPFFTTKPPGKGTGLGLATSFAIVHEAGGWMEFDTEEGKGTEFRVFVPRAQTTQPLAKPDGQSEQREAPKPQRGTAEGVILVVDDESAVRSIAVSMLKYLGYRVVEAADGEAALKLLKDIHAQVDAIMLDVHMPKMSGKDTFKEIRARGIDTPVIICSGFMVEADELKQSTGERGGAISVIQKPYSMDTLARVVSQAVKTSHQALSA